MLAVIRSLDSPLAANPNWHNAAPYPGTTNVPHRILNIGNESSVELLPIKVGNVPDTASEASALSGRVGYRPKVSVEEDVPNFVNRYRGYYS